MINEQTREDATYLEITVEGALICNHQSYLTSHDGNALSDLVQAKQQHPQGHKLCVLIFVLKFTK